MADDIISRINIKNPEEIETRLPRRSSKKYQPNQQIHEDTTISSNLSYNLLNIYNL